MTYTAVEPELVHIEEAARILGIGRTRAYEMAASGRMPGLVQIGRSLRVSRRHLMAWIDERAAAPTAA